MRAATLNLQPLGSSPLSRGIHRATFKRLHLGRIIPALAGNTGCGFVSGAPKRDHPRSRGEYAASTGVMLDASGSSPLSRGIPVMTTAAEITTGIIPALAGNTAPPPNRLTWRTDHPRSRGEYTRGTVAYHRSTGSSPLSRGIPPWRRRCWTSRRIIPALAGNTGFEPVASGSVADHPRSRGEYSPRQDLG